MCLDDNDEPLGLGHWMIAASQKVMIEQRIACPEAGYPDSEALYPSIEAWEEATGKDFHEFCNF